MVGLLVKNLPDHLHIRLKRRAVANRRSMSNELIMILERVLDDRAGPPTLAEIDAMRVKPLKPLTQDILDEALKTGRR